jgi:hypothetical protein
MVATMLAATTVFGEVPTPCWEAYLASGFTRQQMGFDEFRELHSDSECAQGGEGDQEQREFAHKQQQLRQRLGDGGRPVVTTASWAGVFQAPGSSRPKRVRKGVEDVLCGSTYDRAAGREGTLSPAGAEEDPHEGGFSEQDEHATRARPRPAPGCALGPPSREADVRPRMVFALRLGPRLCLRLEGPWRTPDESNLSLAG